MDIRELYLKKGTYVTVGIGLANRDPAVWGDDAEDWKPERWLNGPEEITKERLPGVYSGM